MYRRSVNEFNETSGNTATKSRHGKEHDLDELRQLGGPQLGGPQLGGPPQIAGPQQLEGQQQLGGPQQLGGAQQLGGPQLNGPPNPLGNLPNAIQGGISKAGSFLSKASEILESFDTVAQFATQGANEAFQTKQEIFKVVQSFAFQLCSISILYQ